MEETDEEVNTTLCEWVNETYGVVVLLITGVQHCGLWVIVTSLLSSLCYWCYCALMLLCIDITVHWCYCALMLLCTDVTVHWCYCALILLCIDVTVHWCYCALILLCTDVTVHWCYCALAPGFPNFSSESWLHIPPRRSGERPRW